MTITGTSSKPTPATARFMDYDYDKYGDLITVTLPDESQINYVYQHANMVTNSVTNVYSHSSNFCRNLKPNGRIVQNAYDSQRRVTNQMSTVGSDLNLIRTATFAYTNNFNLSSPNKPSTMARQYIIKIKEVDGHNPPFMITRTM